MREDPCRRHEPALAALEELEELEELALDAEEVAAARAHLAGCARCQARRRMWARLDGALRDALAPTAATPALTTTDLLMAIGADHEPRERRTPMLSVIYVRDEDIMDGDETRVTTAAGTDQAANGSAGSDGSNGTRGTATGAPERRFAPLPSLAPARRRPRQRALMGVAAVVAVAALIAGITGAMSLTGRLGGTQSASHAKATAAAATQTAQVAPFDARPQYQIAGISMDSPTDGWAVMVNEAGNGPTTAIILRISNGKVSKQSELPGQGFFQANIQALSPTNVWLMYPDGQDNLYHYDGKGWMLIHLPAPANAMGNTVSVLALDMLSPTEGFAIAEYSVMEPTSSTTSGSALKLAFYHYDGSAWRIEPADKAATTGSFTDPASNATSNYQDSIQLTGVSAAPGGDAWATGYLQTNDTNNGNPTSTTGYLYHRANGVWHLAQTLPHDELMGVAMTGPNSGWIMATNIRTKKAGGTIAPYTVTIQTPIVLSWDGARWSPASIPQPDQTQSGMTFRQIVAASPSNVWIIGASNGMTVNAGSYASDNTYLIHFDGARWSPASLPQVAAINPSHDISITNQVAFDNLALTPSGDLWMAGVLAVNSNHNYQSAPLLYRYSGGQWSNVQLPTLPAPSSATPASGNQPAG